MQDEECVKAGEGQQTGSWGGVGFRTADVTVVGGAEDPGTGLKSLWEKG